MKEYKLILFLIVLTSGLFGIYGCNHKETIDLKIMSYNIRHGEGMDTILDLSRSANIIKSSSPDLCGLQEIDNYCLRSENVGQTEYLAQYTSMKGTFGKFMDYQGGEYGMATLSAKPLISTIILPLPDAKHEPRSSIVHEVQVTENCTLAFANVHFEWISGKEGSSNRLSQAKVLVKYLDSINRAAIVVGDFNCTPDSPTMQYLNKEGFVFVEKGNDNLSFQGKNKAEIDHVIFRNEGNVRFLQKNARLLEVPTVSDHRPLLVELKVSF